MSRRKKAKISSKKGTANSVHVVLAHFCHQIDVEDEDSDKKGSPPVFESIMEGLKNAGEKREVNIMTVKIACNTKGSEKFKEACVGSEAQLSVIGVQRADLNCQTFGGIRKVTSSQASYRLGDNFYCSIGTLDIRVPVTKMCFVDALSDTVEADVPFLLGLNVLTQLKPHLDYGDDTTASKYDG